MPWNHRPANRGVIVSFSIFRSAQKLYDGSDGCRTHIGGVMAAELISAVRWLELPLATYHFYMGCQSDGSWQ